LGESGENVFRPDSFFRAGLGQGTVATAAVIEVKALKDTDGGGLGESDGTKCGIDCEHEEEPPDVFRVGRSRKRNSDFSHLREKIPIESVGYG
jgi:hypothetical protein